MGKTFRCDAAYVDSTRSSQENVGIPDASLCDNTNSVSYIGIAAAVCHNLSGKA